MAATPLGSGRSFRARRGTGYRPLSEINVTPLVDVMLVLLIIFMVTAPLLTVGVPVDLPQTAAAQLTQREEPLVVSVNAQGRVFLQEREIELATLPDKLREITRNKPDTTIYVRGDKKIEYGSVMSVMGALSSAGFSKVSLVAEFPEPGTQGTKPARAARR